MKIHHIQVLNSPFTWSLSPGFSPAFVPDLQLSSVSQASFRKELSVWHVLNPSSPPAEDLSNTVQPHSLLSVGTGDASSELAGPEPPCSFLWRWSLSLTSLYWLSFILLGLLWVTGLLPQTSFPACTLAGSFSPVFSSEFWPCLPMRSWHLSWSLEASGLFAPGGALTWLMHTFPVAPWTLLTWVGAQTFLPPPFLLFSGASSFQDAPLSSPVTKRGWSLWPSGGPGSLYCSIALQSQSWAPSTPAATPSLLCAWMQTVLLVLIDLEPLSKSHLFLEAFLDTSLGLTSSVPGLQLHYFFPRRARTFPHL